MVGGAIANKRPRGRPFDIYNTNGTAKQYLPLEGTCQTLSAERALDPEPAFSLSDTVRNLLDRAERSNPEAATRRAEGAGLDGESANRAIIDVAAYAD